MILTCPECATSYFVDDERIPSTGRSVRCANCGARWTAKPQPDLELTATPEEGAVAREPPPLGPLKIEPTSVDELPGEALPKVFRARADTERKVRQAATHGVVWAAAVAALLILAALAVVFRTDVVRAWPRSAAAYASIGMPVNTLGLVLEQVKAEPALRDGHAVLAISGQIRNIQDREATSPPLSISLLDKAGKSVATRSARPADPRIPPGETRHFAISVIDPPTTAHDLEVTFAALPKAPKAEAKPAAHAEPAHAAKPAEHPTEEQAASAHPPRAMLAQTTAAKPVAGLRPAAAPPPVEARPLPPDSPYALPPPR